MASPPIVKQITDPRTGEPLFQKDDVQAFFENDAVHRAHQLAGTHKAMNEELDVVTQERIDAVRTFGAAVYNATADLQEHLAKIRQMRMAAVAETQVVLKTLSEVRAFFHGTDYHSEIQRLEHFVTLCERLEALKRNGTLDALVECSLKLPAR
jgi:hypothetical protein